MANPIATKELTKAIHERTLPRSMAIAASRYQRRTTEGYLALDIAVLRRRGLLQPGRSASIITWSREGSRLGSARLFAERGSLRLSYQTTKSEGSAERIDERIVASKPWWLPRMNGGKRPS